MIEEKPEEAENRTEIGHWEVDTVHGEEKRSIATIVDRKTGYVPIGNLENRSAQSANERLRHPMYRVVFPLVDGNPLHSRTFVSLGKVEVKISTGLIIRPPVG